MKVDIVILNYNDWKTTVRYVDSICSYKIYDKIIVVDNCSTDDSIEHLKKIVKEKVILLQANANLGYAAGNNIGVNYAIVHEKVDVVVISNPDIHIKEEAVMKIIEPLKDGYSMSTGLIYNYNSKSGEKYLASNFGWIIPNYRQMLDNCFLSIYKIKRIFNKSIYLNSNMIEKHKYIPTEAVPGCFFAMMAETYISIGKFEEETFLFGEETILGFQLKEKNFKVCIVSDAEVLHENSVSINKSMKKSRDKAKIRLESELVFLRKYLSCSKLQCAIYKLIYKLGQLEKRIIYKFLRINEFFVHNR